MDRKVVVEPGQSMEDIALQAYGSIDGVRNLLFDNSEVFTDGFSTDLKAGTELVIKGDPIDQEMFDTMASLNIRPATNATDGFDVPTGPDYNNDHNNDHLID